MKVCACVFKINKKMLDKFSGNMYSLLICLLFTKQILADYQVTTQVEQGLVGGSVVTNTESLSPLAVFRGIPYSSPPTENLRWHPPSEHSGWPGVLNATQYGPACMQPSDDELYMDEDCLFLNIAGPVSAVNSSSPDLLSVMVYIHGGGFLTGSGADYQPEVSYFSLLKQTFLSISISISISVHLDISFEL